MIKLNDLSLDFAGNIIFKNISLHIKKSDRIGLIGNNGSGKTTLLKLLSKKINPTSGSISQNKDINIAYLPQELYFNSDFSLKEFVVGNNSELIELDIKAENLEEKIDVGGKTLSDSEIESKLGSLDISKPTEFVILNTSESVRKTLSILFEIYEQKSIPKPPILADRKIMNIVKNYLPEHNSISEFSNVEDSNSKLVFIGEMEFDGLFGYETISTRLLKKFGTELMLSAY